MTPGLRARRDRSASGRGRATGETARTLPAPTPPGRGTAAVGAGDREPAIRPPGVRPRRARAPAAGVARRSGPSGTQRHARVAPVGCDPERAAATRRAPASARTRCRSGEVEERAEARRRRVRSASRRRRQSSPPKAGMTTEDRRIAGPATGTITMLVRYAPGSRGEVKSGPGDVEEVLPGGDESGREERARDRGGGARRGGRSCRHAAHLPSPLRGEGEGSSGGGRGRRSARRGGHPRRRPGGPGRRARPAARAAMRCALLLGVAAALLAGRLDLGQVELVLGPVHVDLLADELLDGLEARARPPRRPG